MMTKLYLLAFVCFAFSQVRGEDLEEAKKQALLKLKGTSTGVEKQIQASLIEVNIKIGVVRNKTSSVLKNQQEMEKQIKINLNRTDEEMRKKAKEMNKPPETYECIKKAHAFAVSRLESLQPKFEADLKKLEDSTLASINEAARPLEAIKKSLPAKYDKAVAEVKGCKDTTALRQVMERLGKEYALLVVEAKKILNQVGQMTGRFVSEASASHSRVAEKAGQIEAEGHQTMKNCVWLKIRDSEKQEELGNYLQHVRDLRRRRSMSTPINYSVFD